MKKYWLFLECKGVGKSFYRFMFILIFISSYFHPFLAFCQNNVIDQSNPVGIGTYPTIPSYPLVVFSNNNRFSNKPTIMLQTGNGPAAPSSRGYLWLFTPAPGTNGDANININPALSSNNFFAMPCEECVAQPNVNDLLLTSGADAGHLILNTRRPGAGIKFATTPSTGPDKERLSIWSNGDINIGTVTSAVNMDINANTKIRTLSSGNVTALDANSGFIFADGSGTLKRSSINSLGWGLSGNAAGLNDFIGTINPNPLIFKVNTTERIRITNLGYVGIGNTNPQVALDVNGSAKISTLAGSGPRMVVADANGQLSTQTIPTTGWGLSGNDISSAPTSFIGTTSNNDLVFKAYTNELMRLYSTGNIGLTAVQGGINNI